jgi:hypothetical protein
LKAQDKGIPIILTGNNINTVVQNIEDALEKARFAQEKKSARLAEILEQNLDFPAIDKGLGLAK